DELSQPPECFGGTMDFYFTLVRGEREIKIAMGPCGKPISVQVCLGDGEKWRESYITGVSEK
ncbi:MAG: hypothetical protein P8Y63_13750, partial [Deltaproteobacteria bacterium]